MAKCYQPLSSPRVQARFTMQSIDVTWKPARLVIVMAALIGCSGRPDRIDPPDVDADEAGAAAMQLLDKDGDGQLTAAELESSPGLASAATRYDSDKNGSLSLVEIVAGISRWSTGEV